MNYRKSLFKRIGSEHKGLSILIIEMVAIIFSVLFALILNEWREDVKNQKLVKNIEETIYNEIRSNKKEIHRAYEYHKILIKQLQTGEGAELSGVIDLKEDDVDWSNINELKELLLKELKESGYSPNTFFVAKESDTRILIILDSNRGYGTIENDQLKLFLSRRIQLNSAEIANTAWETAQATQAVIHLNYRLVDLMSRVYRLQQLHETQVRTLLSMLYKGNFEVPALEDLRNIEENLLSEYDEIMKILGNPEYKKDGNAEPGVEPEIDR